MGAAESTPSPPAAAAAAAAAAAPTSQDLFSLPQLHPSRPLHALLHPSATAALPADPDADLWSTLFLDYLSVHSALPFPFRALAHRLLTAPSPPAPRLALAARACTVRLRAYASALAAAQPPPYPPAEVLGALRFAPAFLRELLAQGCPTPALCDLLGSLDGAGDIPAPDRLDIGHSLLWQLISAALDLLALPSSAHVIADSIPIAAAQLVCVALSDDLYANDLRPPSSPAPTREPSPTNYVSAALSTLVDRYPDPVAVICTLIDFVANAAPHADPALFLENGCLPSTSSRISPASSLPNPSAISMAASGAAFGGGGSMGIGMAALAASASASAFSFHSGFNDAISALSSRLPLRRLVGSAAADDVTAESQEGELQTQLLSAPDVDLEPYSHFSPDAAIFAKVRSPPTAATSPRVGGHRSPHANGQRRVDVAFDGRQSREQEPGSNRNQMTNGAISNGIVPDKRLTTGNRTLLAEHALALLCVLCGPRPESPFRKALFSLQDIPKKGQTTELAYSFSKLYEALGKWMTHPRAALFGYYLTIGNRRFRTFTLSRTDPDALLVPLLASMRRRCVLGSTVADAYIPAALVLILTSDKGFCEAIDMISVPNSMLLLIEDKARLGSESIALSGVVMLVCSRVIQQSLVLRRRIPQCFLANICLAIMANVSGDVTNLHSLAAERLLSLVEFLARRRKKAVLFAKHSKEMPVAPPPIGDSPRMQRPKQPLADNAVPPDIYLAASAKVSAFEKSEAFLERLSAFMGMSLEIIASALTSRSVVSANRHLVYTLLHREAILDMEQIAKASVKSEALSHMLRRMIEFFGKYIDEGGESSVDGGARRGVDPNPNATGISVEHVFHVIDKNARHLPPDVFEALPELRFQYEELDESDEFIRPYAWSLVTRGSEHLWNLERVAIPVQNEKFKISR